MRKLYYEDPMLRTFSARVTGCEKGDSGYLVTLDATAFYPEGGGQACDTGVLGGVHVLDVREKEGCVVHLCDAPLEIGAEVTGQIDWARRFDLMQQHTGEHIISGLLHQKFGYHNTGFHVGADVMEVDFDGPISAQDLAEIEYKANEAIWQNLPLRCWTPDPQELETVPYRTKRTLPWPVRIVQVPGFDSCACCGIHVTHTGQIGLIKILSCVKFHKGIRLEMVCGQRAYRHMVRIFEENRQVSQAFSAPMDATGSAALRMNQMLSQEKLRTAKLQEQILEYTAQGYAGKTNVLHFEDDLQPGQLRLLADKLIRFIDGYCAVFSGSDGSYSYCLAAESGDLRQLCRNMNSALNGRGGGKPNFLQGSVRCTKAQIEEFFARQS